MGQKNLSREITSKLAFKCLKAGVCKGNSRKKDNHV